MTVLVTGGAGFIGSHTVVELQAYGHDVIVIDNYSNSTPEVLERVQRITGRQVTAYAGDVQDASLLEKIFQNHTIDAVIHFAGLKAVGESVRIPLKYYHNNIDATLTLVETMERFSCCKLVFSSSATVYGPTNSVPYTEDMPTSATNPYGWTKVMIEQMLRDVAISNPSWSIVSLRYFNPIGAHESGLIGESPKGIPNNLMPDIVKVAADELPELHVFGNDYPTFDGTGVRDYIHVVDLAKGHIKALEYILQHTGCEEINLGTGKGTSVLELVHTFEQVNHVPVPYVIDPRRTGDLAECYAAVGKAEQLLKWIATRDVESMCRSSWLFVHSMKSR